MRIWAPLFLAFLFFSGCSAPDDKPKEKIRFSVLVPFAKENQTTRFLEGIKVITSTLPHSRVSAMVVNNPIRADREAVVAVAIENLGDKEIALDWDRILFFHPKNVIRMLSPDQVCHYFKEPGHSKPVLGSDIFRKEMLAMGALSDKPGSAASPLPTEKRLAQIYRNIRKDLCFVKLPRNASLEPGAVTAGFLVILLPRKHFLQSSQFMLKIPVDGDLHKLRYNLLPVR